MNRIFGFCVLIFLVLGFNSCASMDNNKGTNWVGTYTGIMPGANSDIRQEVTLNKNLTYKLTMEYIDKNEQLFNVSGSFTWKDNNIIELDNRNIPRLYKFENNTLILLDAQGKRITGNIAHMYVLKKK